MRSKLLVILAVLGALAAAYVLAGGDPLGLFGGSGRDAGEDGGGGDLGVADPDGAGGEDGTQDAGARGPRLFGTEALRRRGPGAVRGRVLDARTGKGVPAATLLLTGTGHGKEAVAARATTGSDGLFAWNEVPAGEGYALRVEAPNVGVRGLPGIEVQVGQATDLGDLWLGQVGTIQGKVVDVGGAPVAGAEVQLHRGASSLRDFFAGGGFLEFFRNLDREPEPLARQESKSDGDFRFEGVSPGPHSLLVRAPAFRQTILAVTLTGAGDVEQVVVRLAQGGTLSGSVVDEQGRPVAGVTLVAMSEEGSMPSPLARAFAKSAGDGTFRFDSLAGDGRLMLIAAAQGYPNTLTQVSAGEVGVRVVLRRGATLELRLLRDGDGAPIEGAQLLCSVGEGAGMGDRGPATLIPGTTDQSGVAVIEAPPGQMQMLIVSHPSRPPGFWAGGRGMRAPGMLKGPTDPKVPEGRSQMTFRAPDGVWVVGTVTDSDKRPLAGAEVSVMSFMGGATPVLSAADGSYRLAADRTMGAAVRAELPGWVQDKTNMADPEAVGREDTAEIRVDVVMRAAVALTGRVLTPDGKPLAGANVMVHTVRDGSSFDMAGFMVGAPSSLTLADGSYVVDGIAAGRKIRVQARREGYVDGGTEPFKAPETGSAAAPDVRMLAGATLELRVLAANDRPISAARVHVDVDRSDGVEGNEFEELMASQSGNSDFRTDAAGSVTIPLLPPGKVTLRVSATGHAPGVANVKVTEAGGPKEPVVLRLPDGIVLSGKVLDGQGQPVADARVHVQNLRTANSVAPSDGETGDESSDWGRERRAVTDREGNWKVADLPDRPLRVRVSMEGFKALQHDVGAQREGLELRLQAQEANAEARIAEIDAELQKLYGKLGDKSVDRQALMQQISALQQERQALSGD